MRRGCSFRLNRALGHRCARANGAVGDRLSPALSLLMRLITISPPSCSPCTRGRPRQKVFPLIYRVTAAAPPPRPPQPHPPCLSLSSFGKWINDSFLDARFGQRRWSPTVRAWEVGAGAVCGLMSWADCLISCAATVITEPSVCCRVRVTVHPHPMHQRNIFPTAKRNAYIHTFETLIWPEVSAMSKKWAS